MPVREVLVFVDVTADESLRDVMKFVTSSDSIRTRGSNLHFEEDASTLLIGRNVLAHSQ